MARLDGSTISTTPLVKEGVTKVKAVPVKIAKPKIIVKLGTMVYKKTNTATSNNAPIKPFRDPIRSTIGPATKTKTNPVKKNAVAYNPACALVRLNSSLTSGNMAVNPSTVIAITPKDNAISNKVAFTDNAFFAFSII